MNDLAMDAAVRILKETQDELAAALEREQGLREALANARGWLELVTPHPDCCSDEASAVRHGIEQLTALAATGKNSTGKDENGS